jgi:hypothetical protein
MAIKAEKQINSFIKGLITESSPLTFPENASLDEDNFILNRDGSRSRRLGLEYETDYVLRSSGTAVVEPVSFHEWKLSGGTSDISIGVIRIYNKLWFINMLNQAPSAELLNLGGGSGTYTPDGSLTMPYLTTGTISTAVINNALVIVSPDLPKPVRLIYDRETDVVSALAYQVLVRDFWGVHDGLIDNERPTTLSLKHKYNLLNQGWTPNIQNICGTDPIGCTFATIGVYPSNSDLWHVGKVSDSASANYEKYSPTEMKKRTTAFLTAPKGKHIIDVFNRGYSRSLVSDVPVDSKTTVSTKPSTSIWGTLNKSTVYDNTQENNTTDLISSFSLFSGFHSSTNSSTGTTVSPVPAVVTDTLPIDKETGTFSAVASFAGRMWYSGVRSNTTEGDEKSPNYSGYVFFSQTMTSDDKLGKCYQEADPTSEDISDIVDSDGGAVHIIDAVNIVALIPTKSMLLVFAENGIWQISGGQVNFSATQYDLAKISAIGCNSVNSIVCVNNEVFYWSKGGIFRIVFDQTDGGLKSENLSLTSIQTMYNLIPDSGKQHAIGVFEEKENTLRWLYNDSASYQGTTDFNRELVLDLTLGAFYTNTVDNATVHIAAFVKIPDYAETQNTDEVMIGTTPIIVTNLSAVVVDVTLSVQRDAPFSYLVIDPRTNKFTLAKYRDTTFYDWTIATTTGVNYTSYLVTGYDIFGELMRKKQVPYILFYFDRTEDGFVVDGSGNLVYTNPSSCLVQPQWNWANSANSGKWGTEFQAYRLKRTYIPSGAADTFDYGERVVVTKSKLRGVGRALSLKISSEAGKDMKILGWAMDVTGRATN